jgi:hypothetical protein
VVLTSHPNIANSGDWPSNPLFLGSPHQLSDKQVILMEAHNGQHT